MEKNQKNQTKSTDFILQMIRQSRQNIGKGSENKFLLYGYSAAILSVIAYMLIYSTGDPSWSAIWALIALPFIYTTLRERKRKNTAISYTDRLINETWKVVGTLFIITALTLLMLGYALGNVNLALMMPLALIYCGVGSSITGIILKESVLAYFPPFGLIPAIYMLMTMPTQSTPLSWHLYFGLSLVIIMIVPGHVLNVKSHHLVY